MSLRKYLIACLYDVEIACRSETKENILVHVIIWIQFTLKLELTFYENECDVIILI